MTIKDAAGLAPLLTAFVASVAVIIAVISIRVQRSVARKRAAIDFFLKTEMDEKMLDAYRDSRQGFAALRDGMPMAIFCASKDYLLVRRYLNVHELMAVGIHRGVLDDTVCYSFWADELMRDYRHAKGLIEHIRKTAGEGTAYTYSDLENLDKEWERRLWIAQSGRR